MNKFLLALMVVGLTPFLLGSAYGGGSPSIGVSENSVFLGGSGTDVITDNPCDGTDDDGSDPGDCSAYNFGTEQNPFVISYNPTAGAWHKHMQDPDGDCQSPFCSVTEWIEVDGTWDDWHEILFEPPGMTWFDVTITINPGPGQIVLTDSDPEVMIDDSGFGEAVWVTFDPPLPDGTILKIEKGWELSGPTPTPFNDDGSPCPPPDGTTADCDHPFGEVTILQFPSVPEEEPPREPVVGGEFLPTDSTALILAAAQSPAAWLTTMTFAIIGVGAFLITRNPNNIRNIKVILRDYLDRF